MLTLIIKCDRFVVLFGKYFEEWSNGQSLELLSACHKTCHKTGRTEEPFVTLIVVNFTVDHDNANRLILLSAYCRVKYELYRSKRPAIVLQTW